MTTRDKVVFGTLGVIAVAALVAAWKIPKHFVNKAANVYQETQVNK